MIDRLGYLISTHRDYDAPLQRLLCSMKDRSFSELGVVVGGYEVPDRWFGFVHQVDHNSYDYTALIDYVEHPESYPAWSHVFLLHDTMELGPNADQLIRQADPTLDATAVWGGECNLALYRADYLHSRRDELLSLKDCSKLRAVEVEGFLWRTLGDDRRATYPGERQQSEVESPYGGAQRQRIYFAGVDMVKYKANWGQTWPPNVVTP